LLHQDEDQDLGLQDTDQDQEHDSGILNKSQEAKTVISAIL